MATINIKGRIVDIEKNVHSVTHVVTGIKKKDQSQYTNYTGDCGTYVTGGDYLGTTLDMKVFIFEHVKYNLKSTFSIDIRSYVLSQNNMKNISERVLEYVIEKNKGKKINIVLSDDTGEVKTHFDLSQLDVVPC